MPLRRPVTTADYPSLEKLFDTVLKEKQKFERLVVPKETLLEMFAVRIPLDLIAILDGLRLFMLTVQ